MRAQIMCACVCLLLSASVLAAPQEKSLYVAVLLDGHRDAASYGICPAVVGLVKGLNKGDLLASWLVGAQEVALSTNMEMDSAGKRAAEASLMRCRQRAKKRDLSAAVSYAAGHLGAFQEMDGVATLVLIMAGGNDGSSAALEEEAMAELKAFEIRVHSVAVGPRADRALLMRLADATGGQFFDVPNKAGMNAAMVKLLETLKRLRTQAPPPSPKVKPSAKQASKAKNSAKADEKQDKPTQSGSKDGDGERATKSAAAVDETSEPAPESGAGWILWSIGATLIASLLGLLAWFLVWRKKSRTGVESESRDDVAWPTDTNDELDDAHFDPAAYFADDDVAQAAPMALDEVRPPTGGAVVVARFLALDNDFSDFDVPSDQPGVRVGRKKANDIVLGIKRISGRHAEIRWVDGVLTALDKGSTNGTYVNDERVRGRQLLAGDVVRFDTIAFRIEGQTVVGSNASVVSVLPDEADSTMMMSVDSGAVYGDSSGEPDPTEPMEGRDSLMGSGHQNCLKHKNRIAVKVCDCCTRPYCSQCLMRVLDEELCLRCRTTHEVESV